MPGICFVGQNICLSYVMNKTYSWHTLCWTKPIPGVIGYVRQNLFLAYVMLDKATYGT